MKELELYIHIPFCIKKCAYCDFLSGPSSAEQRETYVGELIKEIKGAKKHTEDYKVTTVFFGGGTPSTLTEEQMQRIMNCVRESFVLSPSAEITMEMNPGTVTEKKLAGYKEAGINRLSIGLQSTNNEELKALGRIHTYEEFLSSYQMARDLGFDNINVDLISAIPGQTVKSWEESLLNVIRLSPEHISAYSLIIEPGTLFYEMYGEEVKEVEGRAKLPSEDAEREMYYVTEKIMNQYGYHRYEISNYSKEGYECRHNKGYWQRVPYLGFGIGAATLFEHTRYSNPDTFEEYVESFENKFHGEELTKKDEMEECMFLGLRMMEGISKKKFREDFQIDFDDVYKETKEKLIEEKLLVEKGDRIALTTRGIDVSNMVFVEFM